MISRISRDTCFAKSNFQYLAKKRRTSQTFLLSRLSIKISKISRFRVFRDLARERRIYSKPSFPRVATIRHCQTYFLHVCHVLKFPREVTRDPLACNRRSLKFSKIFEIKREVKKIIQIILPFKNQLEKFISR